MTRSITIRMCWTFLSFTLAIACDSDSGNTVAGVDKSKKISDLTEDEKYDLCVYMNEQKADIMSVEDQCLAEGLRLIATGLNQSTCEAAVKSCIEKSSDNDTDGDDPCKDESEGGSGNDDLGNCDATVGEMDACMDDIKSLYDNRPVSGLSCSSSKEDVEKALSEAVEEPTTPTSCESVNEKCPGLMNSIEEQSALSA